LTDEKQQAYTSKEKILPYSLSGDSGHRRPQIKKFKPLQKAFYLLLVLAILFQNQACVSTQPPDTVNNKSTVLSNSGISSQANLLKLSLAASNSPAQPADPDTGYPVRDRVFVDWNLSAQTRWFQWSLLNTGKTKALWQVSTMPFDNSLKTLLNPPGLVASGLLGAGQHEFSINFAKFAPRAEIVRTNRVTSPAFYSTALQNMGQASGPGTKIVNTGSGIQALNTAINTRIAGAGTQNITRKSVLNGYSIALDKAAPKINQGKAVIVSDSYMSASKSVLETLSAVKRYSYYVRVIVLDGEDKPAGSPSNSIEVLYGDPVFGQNVSILEKSVEAQVEPTGDFQYRTIISLDWNSSPSLLTKKYAAPLAGTGDYAYTYFQVTIDRVDPDVVYALYPDGLEKTILSSELGSDSYGNNCAVTRIDFSKFAPPPDKANPIQYRYYVRAVNVYSDYQHPGYARLAFSPPMVVNYGDPKAAAVDDSLAVNIDIGTPVIRFTQYTPPYFGDNPSDHAIVTAPPGSPFQSLKPGDKVSISALQTWLEDKARADFASQNVLLQIAESFKSLFTGIGDLITSVSNAWSQIQAAVVSTLADIGIPPAIGGFLVNAALMAAGIPPTLPNFDDLSSMGAGQFATMLVEQSGGIVPPALAEAAANELMNQAQQAASTAIGGLPDDLSGLNGCLKPDTDYVWKPATISVELYNPLKTQIPSGSFLLRFVEAGQYPVTPDNKDYFYPQVVNYPPVKGEKTLTLTIPLDEACEKSVYQGEKGFADGKHDYPNTALDTTWTNLIYGHKQLAAVITDIQPIIPNPSDFGKELGMGNIVFIHFNIMNNLLNIQQDLHDIMTGWNAPDDRFPSAIYVSPGGNDAANGSVYHPVRTLQHALDMAGKGDAILLQPGMYITDTINISKPFLTIAGTSPGVVIKPSQQMILPLQPITPPQLPTTTNTVPVNPITTITPAPLPTFTPATTTPTTTSPANPSAPVITTTTTTAPTSTIPVRPSTTTTTSTPPTRPSSTTTTIPVLPPVRGGLPSFILKASYHLPVFGTRKPPASLNNAGFLIKADKTATELHIKDVEVDGGIYIKGSDGLKLENIRVINFGSTGIELVRCSMPLITGCEVANIADYATGQYHGSLPDAGIVLDNSYAFRVTGCNIHDISGYGVKMNKLEVNISETSSGVLGTVENSSISNCLTGVLISGGANSVKNCFIHDTQWAGIDFSVSSNCQLLNCTLSNTSLDYQYDGAPILFNISPDGTNRVDMENTQGWVSPESFYAENNIITGTNNYIIFVKTNSDKSQIGIDTTQASYVRNNIYYSDMGPARFVDQRTNRVYQYTITGSTPSGITSGWAGLAFDNASKELNPKIDGQGRSALPDCFGKGVQ
jgi:hypothetical protein